MKHNKKYSEKPMNFENEEIIEKPINEVEEIVDEPENSTKPYIVTGALINLRKGPTRESKIIKAVIKDTKIDISEIEHNNDEWCDYGYIPAEDAWINLTYAETI